MAHKKKKFTRTHVAQALHIQEYMIVAWENHFDIEPIIENGEAFYTQKHFHMLTSIKELLYEKGLSFAAAKKYLEDSSSIQGTTLIAASPLRFEHQSSNAETPMNASIIQKAEAQHVALFNQENNHQMRKQLVHIKEQLHKLRQSLS